MFTPKTLRSLGRGFSRRLEEKAQVYDMLAKNNERPKQRRAQWIGQQAQLPWITNDLKKHCGKRSPVVDPLGVVSNLGDPRRTDVLALVAGETVQFELKKSDYGGERVSSQLSAQVFDLGLGTRGASSLVVIYGETGRIEVYTREDAKEAVDAVLNKKLSFQIPAPAAVIDFRPGIDE